MRDVTQSDQHAILAIFGKTKSPGSLRPIGNTTYPRFYPFLKPHCFSRFSLGSNFCSRTSSITLCKSQASLLLIYRSRYVTQSPVLALVVRLSLSREHGHNITDGRVATFSLRLPGSCVFRLYDLRTVLRSKAQRVFPPNTEKGGILGRPLACPSTPTQFFMEICHPPSNVSHS